MLAANPYRPGAGHQPPYLAGRHKEREAFSKLLDESVITKNLIITGLRGVGKTVLLESLKPVAREKKWLWTSVDLSESASVSEESLARRIIADIAIVTSEISIPLEQKQSIGFTGDEETTQQKLNFHFLVDYYSILPGLVSDKLIALFFFVWTILEQHSVKGVVFAYDEAQTMSDRAESNQFPLSTLLVIFQSIQRKNIPFLLVLTGLPTLQTKLIEARTYSERMFTTLTLGSLTPEESREAIVTPLTQLQPKALPLPEQTPLVFSEKSIETIILTSGGYPYFIQFICKEAYDALSQKIIDGVAVSVPIEAIVTKLDEDFFAARWLKATDRQQDLLKLIANLDKSEFTPKDILESVHSKTRPFKQAAQVIKMLGDLTESGLIYKNKRGVYSFAVPMLGDYIRRNYCNNKTLAS